jgi:hypothetical protein
MTTSIFTTLANLLTGCTLCGFKRGHGSFFELHFAAPDQSIYAIWVYLCDWAFLKHGVEFASSDTENVGAVIDLSDLVGKRLEKLVLLEGGSECHLDLTDGYRLEMWENDAAYPNSQEMFKVFKNDRALVTFPSGDWHENKR